MSGVSCSSTSSTGSSSSSSNGGNSTFFAIEWVSLGVLYISYRMAIANYSPITDCDETYNYWEPLHFLVYNAGFQTWEYAKPYQLRTYSYLVVPYYLLRIAVSTTTSSHGLAQLLSFHDKRTLFYSMRSIIGAITAICELYYASGIWNVFGKTIAFLTLFSLAISPGMFHAASALLPSTAVMQYVMASIGHTLRTYPNHNNPNYERCSILLGLLATLTTGWPFAAALFLPLGLRAIYLASSSTSNSSTVSTTTSTTSTTTSSIDRMRSGGLQQVGHVLLRTTAHTLLIQTIVSAIDYHYYQTFTIPTWNILKYNAMQGDDTLYGTEPLSYYIKNIALNFNLMAILATFAFPILGGKLMYLYFQQIQQQRHNNALCQQPQQQQQQQQQQKELTLPCMMLYTLSPMVLWLVLVCSRPHKEERFLFPIYPFIALACAYALHEIIRGTVRFITGFPALRTMVSSRNTIANGNKSPSSQTKLVRYRLRSFLYLGFVLPVTLLSISRSLALHAYYMAPLYIYSSLYDSILTPNRMESAKSTAITTPTTTTTTVCVAGEWYRFPGSFLLPQGSTLAFLPSSFKGQLPQPFLPSLGSAATPDQIPQPFNSRNREEPSRYVHDIGLCDYVVELLPSLQQGNDRDYVKQQLLMTDQWEEIATFPFLDADATSSTLGRTLYIPPWLLTRFHIPIYFAKYSLFRQMK